jgi:O-antigen/teichoic acid export membrane protein
VTTEAPPATHSRLRAAVLTYATNIGAAVLGLVNVLIVARTLGPVGRGDVAFLIAVGTLTANLATLGVEESNANIGGTRPDRREALATNSVIFAVAFGAIAAVLLILLTARAPAVGGQAPRMWLIVVCCALPIFILKVYLQFLAQSDYKFTVTNVAWIIGPVTTATANVTLVSVGRLSVGTAISAWIVGQSLGTLILIVHISRSVGFGTPDLALGKESIAFGLKTAGGRFMQMGNYRGDQWFVGAIAGSRELGYYTVAVAWAEVLYYIPGVLVLVQRPDLVRASREEAAELATRVFRIALIISGCIAALLVIAAPWLCTLVFGAEFSSSVVLLRVLALAAFGICALEILGNAFTAQRRPLLTTAVNGITFLGTVSLCITLIPPFGALGAAIATSGAYTVGGVATIVLFRRALPTPLEDFVLRMSDARWLYSKLRT